MANRNRDLAVWNGALSLLRTSTSVYGYKLTVIGALRHLWQTSIRNPWTTRLPSSHNSEACAYVIES